MVQFVAYIYSDPRGYRVFVEGLGDALVSTLDEAGTAAFAIVARSVFASYPDRTLGDRPGTADRIDLELRIVRASSRSGPHEGERPDLGAAKSP